MTGARTRATGRCHTTLNTASRVWVRMSRRDSEWRPEGATESFNGFEVWDHGVWPNELHTGEVDGDVSLDD